MPYAIKTAKGYLAVQGHEHWFEDEPKGWAVYPTEEHARDVGEAHHSAIGTKTEEGYTLVSLRRELNREILSSFCDAVRDNLIAHSDQWPDEWDGHEIRALCAEAFKQEITGIMQENRERRKSFLNEWATRNLY